MPSARYLGGVILAELEVFHSRPIAPTRRVAVGRANLPVDDSPGYGGLLLGGIIARYSGELEDDLLPDLAALTYSVERGERVPQPRLRHRLQADRVGLLCSTHRLVRDDQTGLISFEFDDTHTAPAQNVLAAIYAARHIPYERRLGVMASLRRAIGWTGQIEDPRQLVSHLCGDNPVFMLAMASGHNDPVSWALDVLGIDTADDKSAVQKSFRRLLRTAHPDTADATAAAEDLAAQRIAELTEARRILLAS